MVKNPLRPTPHERPPAQDSAEALALQALAWCLEDDGRRGAFLAATGAAPGDLADLAGDRAFLAGVLQFITQDDRTVLAFAAATGHRPEAPLAALHQLGGGPGPDWT
jgi:hypothetical protein